MLHCENRASVKLALVFITWMAAAVANASLLDCTSTLGVEPISGAGCAPAERAAKQAPTYGLQEAIPATPINAALAAFQIDQTRHTDPMSNSAPLLVLMGALLAVLLVRAKRFNTK